MQVQGGRSSPYRQAQGRRASAATRPSLLPHAPAGHKLLLFAHHQEVLDALEAQALAKVLHVRIDGHVRAVLPAQWVVRRGGTPSVATSVACSPPRAPPPAPPPSSLGSLSGHQCEAQAGHRPLPARAFVPRRAALHLRRRGGKLSPLRKCSSGTGGTLPCTSPWARADNTQTLPLLFPCGAGGHHDDRGNPVCVCGAVLGARPAGAGKPEPRCMHACGGTGRPRGSLAGPAVACMSEPCRARLPLPPPCLNRQRTGATAWARRKRLRSTTCWPQAQVCNRGSGQGWACGLSLP